MRMARRRIIIQERIRWKIKGRVADVAAWVLGNCRRVLRWSHSRCSWCGADCGFSSSISRKGMRCATYTGRDCENMP
jgi:hypothetical protein